MSIGEIILVTEGLFLGIHGQTCGRIIVPGALPHDGGVHAWPSVSNPILSTRIAVPSRATVLGV